jgi:sulfoxide reductase heme-binding subunit YedZ
MAPWNDRSGRFSLLKAATFAGLFVPGLLIAYWLWSDQLGPLYIKEVIHRTGDWAVRFLLITLTITPLARFTGWTKVIALRRMLGLATLAYALAHFSLFIVDQSYDLRRVAVEIYLRIYLTIGFVTLLGLVALGATSFDAAIRKLGKKWKMLHMAIYGIAVLAILHFFMQSKINVTEPTLMAGFYFLLMSYRIMIASRISPTPLALVGACAAAGLVTAGAEMLWYGIATGIDPISVLQANLALPRVIRPAWIVVGVGLLVAVVVQVSRRTNLRGFRPAVAKTAS